MNYNKAILIGNITKDIELKTTPSGKIVASFGLATNRSWKDEQGNKKEQATFHNIVAWGKTAEVINQWCSKGSSIMIEGRIDNRSYEKKDGGKGYISEVIVESFQFGYKKLGDNEVEQSRKSPEPKKEEIKTIDPDDIEVVEDYIPLEQDSIDIKDIPY